MHHVFYDDLTFPRIFWNTWWELLCFSEEAQHPLPEKVGLAWQESGIRDVASAKQETTTFNKHYYTIFESIRIRNRAPVEKKPR